MITVVKDLPDTKRQEELVLLLDEWYDEARQLLPGIPEEIEVYFDNWCLIPEQGTGGYAYSPTILTIAFDLDYHDSEKQLEYLRQTVFHEAFHLAQGYTGQGGPYSALESAIYEGCATVFERDYAGAKPGWGNYRDEEESSLKAWREELGKISAEEFSANDGLLWHKWAFTDEESGERWRLYKVGTWLTDKALAATSQTILELQNKAASDILRTIQ